MPLPPDHPIPQQHFDLLVHRLTHQDLLVLGQAGWEIGGAGRLDNNQLVTFTVWQAHATEAKVEVLRQISRRCKPGPGCPCGGPIAPSPN